MTLISRAQEIRSEISKDANTAERVGSLFEDIVSEVALGKMYFGNGGSPVVFNLTQNTNTKLTQQGGLFTTSIDSNISVNSDSFVIEKKGIYRVSGMISFEGKSGGNYYLMIFKNDQQVCDCNPHVEVLNNRTTNLVVNDIVECEIGDTVELYVKNSAGSQTIHLVNSKLNIEKIPFA